MKIIYGISKIRKLRAPVVAALGVFDGVHCGHRHILKKAVSLARRLKGTSVVITFYPHPRKEKSLYSLEHRLRLIAELGVDVCIVIKFSRLFRAMPAEEFVKNILTNKIRARFIYIGENFRFGKAAQGNWKLLESLSALYNYKIRAFKVIKINRQPVSSTVIRGLITRGKLAEAQRLLGRPVTVLGTVVRGISLARNLGFPTANIDPHHEIIPPPGVYAVKIVLGDEIFCGVCNIARNLTLLHHHLDKKVEVHIFGLNKDIYGRILEMQFLQKIREERKFPSLSLLAAEIKNDVSKAKKIFPRHCRATQYMPFH